MYEGNVLGATDLLKGFATIANATVPDGDPEKEAKVQALVANAADVIEAKTELKLLTDGAGGGGSTTPIVVGGPTYSYWHCEASVSQHIRVEFGFLVSLVVHGPTHGRGVPEPPR